MAKKYKRYVTIGRDENGKRIRKFFMAIQSRSSKNIRDYWIEASRVSNPSTVSFKDYSEQWLETYKSERVPGHMSFMRTR